MNYAFFSYCCFEINRCLGESNIFHFIFIYDWKYYGKFIIKTLVKLVKFNDMS